MKTCKNCKHWKSWGWKSGDCSKLLETDKLLIEMSSKWNGSGGVSAIETDDDFGCVLWESKSIFNIPKE